MYLLVGTIPSTICGLTAIVGIDLSYNKLSGNVLKGVYYDLLGTLVYICF